MTILALFLYFLENSLVTLSLILSEGLYIQRLWYIFIRSRCDYLKRKIIHSTSTVLTISSFIY